MLLALCASLRACVKLILAFYLTFTKQAKAFELSYLEKVPEVKDTVHKQSLLHHVCTMVVENFPDSSDLYSEIGAVTRSAKVRPWARKSGPCLSLRCWISVSHLGGAQPLLSKNVQVLLATLALQFVDLTRLMPILMDL